MALSNKMKNNQSLAQNPEVTAGFTLIEILVAISVLAVTATMALPFLNSWYSSIKLKGAQRELTSNFRFTQQNAVTSQKNHLIRINVAQNYYQVIKKDGIEVVLKMVYLPQNIVFDTINLTPLATEVEFNAAAVPNSTGEINIKNNKDKTAKIEITPSGFVRGD